MARRVPYTRIEFEQARIAAAGIERSDGIIVALVSVGLGAAQLAFVRWAEHTMARPRAVAFEATFFIIYVLLVAVSLFRMQRRRGAVGPRCPTCGRRLDATSQRIAIASGNCDTCGASVLATAASVGS